MERVVLGIRLSAMLGMMILVSSCASTLYVAGRCDDDKKNQVIPVYNATSADFEVIHDIWKEWPVDDYILPPWLDSSLNMFFIVVDIPISIVFDTITLPFQGIDYLLRRDQIRKAKEDKKPGYSAW